LFFVRLLSQRLSGKSGEKLSKYKHLGKAGSPAHIDAVLQVASRNQINELQRAINSLSESWLEVVFAQEKEEKKASSK